MKFQFYLSLFFAHHSPPSLSPLEVLQTSALGFKFNECISLLDNPGLSLVSDSQNRITPRLGLVIYEEMAKVSTYADVLD